MGEYTPGAGRHIQGCYIDHDAVRSRADCASLEEANVSRSDVHGKLADEVLKALASQAEFCYGEGLDMLQHALQSADCARQQGEPRAAILASLMHDVGNSPQARAAWEAAGNGVAELLVSPSDNSIGYRHHACIGATFLESLGFDAEVAG